MILSHSKQNECELKTKLPITLEVICGNYYYRLNEYYYYTLYIIIVLDLPAVILYVYILFVYNIYFCNLLVHRFMLHNTT